VVEAVGAVEEAGEVVVAGVVAVAAVVAVVVGVRHHRRDSRGGTASH
jgi:hypothetical protein